MSLPQFQMLFGRPLRCSPTSLFLPGVRIDDGIAVTRDPAAAAGAQALLLVALAGPFAAAVIFGLALVTAVVALLAGLYLAVTGIVEGLAAVAWFTHATFLENWKD